MHGDAIIDPASPYFIDTAHPYAAAAASALASLPLPDPLPASAASAVLLLLRHRPHVALSFHQFALRRLPARSPPPLILSASVAHVAAVLSSATCHYSPSQIFNALAATYRRFASAPFVFDLLLHAYLRVVDIEERRVEEALGILRAEMKKEEFAPNRGSYEVLIRGFCEEGEVEVAMRLQAEMAGKGFKVSGEVYHAFVRAYEKDEDHEMVERLRKEMAAIGIEDASDLDCMQ